jgi:hypothetical protein
VYSRACKPVVYAEVVSVTSSPRMGSATTVWKVVQRKVAMAISGGPGYKIATVAVVQALHASFAPHVPIMNS